MFISNDDAVDKNKDLAYVILNLNETVELCY